MERYHQYPNEIYAGFWMRFFAYSIDILMIGSLQRVLLFYLESGWIKNGLSLGIYFIYFVLMTKFGQGQTLGKMIFGLRVVCFNEEKLSWATVITREMFGRYIHKIFIILYPVLVFTDKSQHLVDLLVDTAVISEKSRMLYEKVPLVPTPILMEENEDLE